MGNVETKLEYLATKEDFEKLKAFLSDQENRNLRWTVGTIIAAVAVFKFLP